MGPYGSSVAPYEFGLRVRGPYSFNAYIISLRAPYGLRDHKQPVNHPCGDRTGPYGPRTATFDARAGFCKLRLCQFPNVSLWLFWYTYKKFGDRLHKCSVSDILFFFFYPRWTLQYLLNSARFDWRYTLLASYWCLKAKQFPNTCHLYLYQNNRLRRFNLLMSMRFIQNAQK